MRFFNGEPVWHVSFAPKTAAHARHTMLMTLDGVGDQEHEHWEEGMTALHLRRKATLTEKRQANLSRLGEAPQPLIRIHPQWP